MQVARLLWILVAGLAGLACQVEAQTAPLANRARIASANDASAASDPCSSDVHVLCALVDASVDRSIRADVLEFSQGAVALQAIPGAYERSQPATRPASASSAVRAGHPRPAAVDAAQPSVHSAVLPSSSPPQIGDSSPPAAEVREESLNSRALRLREQKSSRPVWREREAANRPLVEARPQANVQPRAGSDYWPAWTLRQQPSEVPRQQSAARKHRQKGSSWKTSSPWNEN